MWYVARHSWEIEKVGPAFELFITTLGPAGWYWAKLCFATTKAEVVDPFLDRGGPSTSRELVVLFKSTHLGHIPGVDSHKS